MFRLCTNAEKAIKLVRLRQHAWSPCLEAASKEANHWKMRNNNKKDEYKTTRLINLAKAMGIEDSDKKTELEITLEMNQSFTRLEKVRHKAKEKRVEFLMGLAEKYAADNCISEHQAILEIMAHEEIREMYRHIRLKMKGAQFLQLSEVWLQASDGTKQIIDETLDLENHLLERNKNN